MGWIETTTGPSLADCPFCGESVLDDCGRSCFVWHWRHDCPQNTGRV